MTAASAPIALFCFNRPRHLLRTIESLKACPDFDISSLHVYADGPRNAADLTGVTAVRELLTIHLKGAARITARVSNVGLAANIIEGVTAICAEFGRVIVLEDDLLLDPRFLTFMNGALEKYEYQNNVLQIAGHLSEVPQFANRRAVVPLPWASCWGWATWKRAWNQFDSEAEGWKELANDRRLRRRFNLHGIYDYTTMLERQMHGELNSWGVRWYWSIFRAGGLVIYPPFNLVDNTGFDGSGTHGRGRLRRFGRSTLHHVPPGSIEFPSAATYDEGDAKNVLRALWHDNGAWIGHFADRLKRALWRTRCRIKSD